MANRGAAGSRLSGGRAPCARPVVVKCGSRALPAYAWLLACSGEPFYYAAPPAGLEPSGSGGVPPLVAVSAGTGGAVQTPPPAAAGADPVETGPDPPPPPSRGPCGVLRSGDPRLEDGEVCLEEATFPMGSDDPNLDGFLGHGPEHDVTVSAFALDAFEVTVARYRSCIEAGGCEVPDGSAAQGCTYSAAVGALELYPITCVTHDQARAFCQWDGGRSLPTEAQWERAARGEQGRSYPWGESFGCGFAVVEATGRCTDYAGLIPQKVGSATAGASEEGVYDLVGNAAEWVADWAGPYPFTPQLDPTGAESGSVKLIRGGGWRTRAAEALAYLRLGGPPDAVAPFSFRCARAGDSTR